MCSSESPVHGKQEGSASGGHFLSRCYRPLFVFNQHGDCEGAHLRPGNVHSADGWRDLLEPIVDRYRTAGKRIYFREDAAFASPDLHEYLEDNNILYAIRIKANSRLHKEIDHLMTRPVGRPSARPRAFCHPRGKGLYVRTGPDPIYLFKGQQYGVEYIMVKILAL